MQLLNAARLMRFWHVPWMLHGIVVHQLLFAEGLVWLSTTKRTAVGLRRTGHGVTGRWHHFAKCSLPGRLGWDGMG
eukprot:358368-Chlamydomonas_euryale.AAC.1